MKGPRIALVNDRGRPIGEDHHRAKLTNHDVDLVLSLLAEGLSYSVIAEKFEISKSMVRHIAKGTKRWQVPAGQKFIRGARFYAADPDEFEPCT